MPQGVHRIPSRSGKSMGPDRQPGDDRGEYAACKKPCILDVGCIGVILQPAGHGEVNQRPGDCIGQKDVLHEILRQQEHDGENRRSENLSDPDLPGPLLNRKGGQAQEAQAGHEDRKKREGCENRAELAVGPVQPVEVLIQGGSFGSLVVHLSDVSSVTRQGRSGFHGRWCFGYRVDRTIAALPWMCMRRQARLIHALPGKISSACYFIDTLYHTHPTNTVLLPGTAGTNIRVLKVYTDRMESTGLAVAALTV